MNDFSPRLLVIRLSALGDVAMTLPVIYSLARQYPRLRITVLTRAFFARLFIHKPGNVELLAVEEPPCRLSAHFDYVADLHNVLRSWMMDASFLCKGRKVRIVNKTRFRRKLLTVGHRRTSHPNYIHRYEEVFARLGFPVKTDFRSLFEECQSEPPFEVEVRAVGIAPFARYANKTYPLELMEQVVAQLTAEGHPVYLFGGRGTEAALLETWQECYPRCHSLAGKFTIEQELAVISRLQLMVSMDSANQHLASLTGTTAVTIWGGTTPACGFLGYRQEETNALCLNLPCQPCCIAGSNRCRRQRPECLYGIAPEIIVQKIKRLIG